MKYPRDDFPWAALANAGFTRVLALFDLPYDPTPLRRLPPIILEDLFHGGRPQHPEEEVAKVTQAAKSVVEALRHGDGIVIHCEGGSGRTGTVIGCALRDLGHAADEVVSYLDRLHKARGKRGWPESPWQEGTVRNYRPDA
jgi:protein-tyrosine phosphatase